MTNPGDIVRVRARRGGRASIYEANGWCQGFTDGLLDGNGVIPNTVADLNVLVGGTPSCPDVVLAKNPAGYRIALDLVGQQAITLTTPASNSRISSIVAYTDDLSLATNQSNVTGSPASCGLIIVNGAASASPVPPTETEIRAAITADGATGSQACYGVIASVTVASNATTITTTNIDIQRATLAGKIASHNVDWETFGETITVKKYSLTLQSNPYVAPFTAQHYIDLAPDMKTYGTPIAVSARGGSGEGISAYIDYESKRVNVTGVAERPKATVCVTFAKSDIVQLLTAQ